MRERGRHKRKGRERYNKIERWRYYTKSEKIRRKEGYMWVKDTILKEGKNKRWDRKAEHR